MHSGYAQTPYHIQTTIHIVCKTRVSISYLSIYFVNDSVSSVFQKRLPLSSKNHPHPHVHAQQIGTAGTPIWLIDADYGPPNSGPRVKARADTRSRLAHSCHGTSLFLSRRARAWAVYVYTRRWFVALFSLHTLFGDLIELTRRPISRGSLSCRTLDMGWVLIYLLRCDGPVSVGDIQLRDSGGEPNDLNKKSFHNDGLEDNFFFFPIVELSECIFMSWPRYGLLLFAPSTPFLQGNFTL